MGQEQFQAFIILMSLVNSGQFELTFGPSDSPVTGYEFEEFNCISVYGVCNVFERSGCHVAE